MLEPIKRRRKRKRVRYRQWMPEHFSDLDDLYDLDFPQSERVMPRGERERRSNNEEANHD